MKKHGLVAHLVERLTCTEEVAGSSPVESTKTKTKAYALVLLFLRDLFLSKNPDLLKTDNIITKMYNIFIQNINPDPIKRNDERNNILKISNILDEMNLTQIQELCKLHV